MRIMLEVESCPGHQEWCRGDDDVYTHRLLCLDDLAQATSHCAPAAAARLKSSADRRRSLDVLSTEGGVT